MMKHIISLLVALAVWVGCRAQSLMPNKYNVSYLNMATGMPNNFADDIFQDSYGFIWISTHGGGLVRYDGYKVASFGYTSTPIALRSNSCRNVCEDRFRRLWIAFEEGPQVLDLETMRPVVPPCVNAKMAERLHQVFDGVCLRTYCDSKGCIWMATTLEIVRIAFDQDGKVESILTTPCPTAAPEFGMCDVYGRGSVMVCNNGRVSDISVREGRLVQDDVTAMFAPLANRYAASIIKYNNKIWLATNDGLFCSDGRQFHTYDERHTLQHSVATSLAISPEGRLLVGTLCGVDIIDDRTGAVEHWNSMSQTNPLSSNFVNCLLVKDGRTWIGTEMGGVVKLVPRHLQITYYANNPDDPTSLARNAVNAMYAAPDGSVWVGVVEGGLNVMRPGSKAFTHYRMDNSNLPHNSVSTLTPDGNGNLWIGTWGGGVAVVDPNNPDKIWRLNVDSDHQFIDRKSVV